MRILTKVLVVVLATSSFVAFGAANVAMVPTALRQSYSDGSSTEISCLPVASSPDGCVFIVKAKNRRDNYTLETPGFRSSLYISEYWYWPRVGDDFSLALPIACPEEGLANIPPDMRPSAECRLFLTPNRNTLVPERLEIIGSDGTPLHIDLGPNNSFKPKPLRGSA